MSQGRRSLGLAGVVLAIALGACIERSEEPELGDTTFIAGQPTASLDYSVTAAGTQQPGAGTGATTAPTTPTDTTTAAPTDPTAAGTPTAPTAGTPTDPAAAGTPADPGAGTAGAAAPIPDPGQTTDPDPGTDTGAAGGGAPAVDPAAATPGTLTVSFTSVAVGGRYAPRNVGAVWIETESGTFVKTLKRWAGIRANHLSNWNRASGGWSSFFGIGATADELDAMTGATLRSHEMHSVTWDMIDNDEQVVPDGKYVVKIEVADDNLRASGVASATFEKGAMPVQLSPPDQSPYRGLSLSYQP